VGASGGSSTIGEKNGVATTNSTLNTAIPGHLVPKGTLNIERALTWPPTFDPFGDSDAPNLGLYSWVFEGLVRQAPDGTFVPWLAKNWKFSPDGLTLTFQLRHGITFSDGEPFNAAAAKKSLDYVMTGPVSQVLPENAETLGNVKSVVATSPYVLTLHLKTADRTSTIVWLAKNAGLIVAPKALGKAATDPIGTGPFTINVAQSNSDHTQVVLNYNPHYWLKGTIGFQKVVMNTVADTSSEIEAYQSGQYDIGFENLPTGAPKTGKEVMGTSVRYFFVINDWQGKQIPALKNIKVREAMAEAVPRQGIQTIEGTPPQTMVTQWAQNPGQYGWIKNFKAPSFNLDLAKSTFKASGQKGFSFATRSFPGPTANVWTAWAGALKELGITVNASVLNPPSGDQMFKNFADGTYPVQWIPFEQATPLLALEQIAMPNGGLNSAHAAPPGVVSLVKKAEAAPTDAQAAPYVEAAWKIMLDQYIWIPLWVSYDGFMVHNDIVGVQKVNGLPATFYPQGVYRK